jgi:hypothetical protein
VPETGSRSRRIRRLSEEEIASYDLIPPDLARRARLVRVPVLIGPYSGMTLGRFILLAHDVSADGSSKLVAHELIHLRQWNELGVVGFLVGYLVPFLRGLWAERSWDAAYRRIPAEQEAYDRAGAWHAERSGPTTPDRDDQP